MSTCLAPRLTADSASPVAAACRRIPPLWPLESFAAVNPFLGFASWPFELAATTLERNSRHGIFMDSAWYLERIASGEIPTDAAAAALSECHIHCDTDPLQWLRDHLTAEGSPELLFTAAAALDLDTGSQWASFITGEISKWCSSYFDCGQAVWAMPFRSMPLFAAWKAAAQCDRAPELSGLTGFRNFIAALPDTASEAIPLCLDRLGVSEHEAADLLHCELLSVFGWSAWAARVERDGAAPGTLEDLLAIRLAYDAALTQLGATWSFRSDVSIGGAFTPARFAAQCALEIAFRMRTARQLHPPSDVQPARHAKLQAVFCIDVRSEVYRRALEAQSEEIATIGFAGFFGLAMDVEGSARCPVLLQPAFSMAPAPAGGGRLRRALSQTWQSLRESATACFHAVEVGGAAALAGLGAQSLRGTGAYTPPQPLALRLPLQRRIELAGAALANMGLAPRNLAPLVLFCGHGSLTANNPYEASLDCGACGGHKGDCNARLLAELCNDAAVRKALHIPRDTVFAAAIHITTTDEVVLLDAGPPLPAPMRLELEQWLAAASRQARIERNAGSGVASRQDYDPLRESRARAASWAEVRPEWGLAGNAAFIAAPRYRTRGVNLQGRAFLHDYNAALDPDGSVLNLILTAPVVVASWINLQYFGSVVDSGLYGSGDKVLHNVVGRFGVWEGNGGDLRFGLPLQSLHDGRQWRHEPLRLQVFVEARRGAIDAVLLASEDFRNLVANSWLNLIAIEEDEFFLCRRPGEWKALPKSEGRPRECSLPADGLRLSCAG
jgi:uncharacterized protein